MTLPGASGSQYLWAWGAEAPPERYGPDIERARAWLSQLGAPGAR